MDNKNKQKIKDEYMKADNWLKLHWRKILVALIFALFVVSAMFSKDHGGLDPYDSEGAPEHMR